MVTSPGSTRSSVAPMVAITRCFAKLARTRSGLNGASAAMAAVHADVLSCDVGHEALHERAVQVVGAEDAPASVAHAALDQVEEHTAGIAVGLDFGFAKDGRAAAHRGMISERGEEKTLLAQAPARIYDRVGENPRTLPASQMSAKALSIVCLLLCASAAAAQQQSFVGCYSVQVAEWSPGLGSESRYHRLPSSIVLDTVRRGPGRILSPDIAYPGGSRFPTTPRWEANGDTLVLTWSNGFTPTIVRLVAKDTELMGDAVALTDVHHPIEPPRPRAKVVARKQACGQLHRLQL